MRWAAEIMRYDISLPIRSYLPDIEMMDEQRSMFTSLHDLLSHRVGVPRYDMLWVTFHKKNTLKWVKQLDFISQFRTSFIYSNIMYNLAGEILERVSGESWSDLVHTHIFKPLGMTGARLIGDADVDRKKLVRSYFNLTNNSDRITPMFQDLQLAAEYAQPATGVTLTLNDMTFWMKQLTKTGYFIDKGWQAVNDDPLIASLLLSTRAANAYYLKANTDRYINKEVVDQKRFAAHHAESYGRGWLRHYYRGRLALLHGGSLFGVRSFLSWFPREGISVFVTANVIISRSNPFFEVVPRYLNLYLADLVLNETAWINEDNVCHFLKARTASTAANSSQAAADKLLSPTVRLRTLTGAERSALPGIYASPLFGHLRLRYNRTSRRLEMNFGAVGRLQLLPVTVDNETTGPIRMLVRVVGPLWFYTSHLMDARLEDVARAELTGRVIGTDAMKFSAAFSRCEDAPRLAVRLMRLDLLEPVLAPTFARIGGRVQGDDFTCAKVPVIAGAAVSATSLLALLCLAPLVAHLALL